MGLLCTWFRVPGEYTPRTTDGARVARDGPTPLLVSRTRRLHAPNYRWCEGSKRWAYSAPGFACQASTRPEPPMVQGEQETGPTPVLVSRSRRVHARNYRWCEGGKRWAYSGPGFAYQASTRLELPMVRGWQEMGLLRPWLRARGEYTPGTTDGARVARDGLTLHLASRTRRVHARNYRWCEGSKRWAYSAPGFAYQASTRPEIPMVRG
jgi:hypothetical protein